LRTILNPYSETTTYSYDALSRASRQDNANSTYATYAYNSAGWMTGVSNKKSDATVISSFAYNYDNVGNRLRMTEANGDYTSFVYDNIYQLTDERKKTSGETDIYRVTYVYDAVGNRTDMTKDGTRTTYSYDSANKMSEFTAGGSRTTFSYDGNGNQIAKTVPGGNITTNVYNYENKMVGITYPDSSLNTFSYDGDGKRLQKQDSTGTLRMVFDPQGPTGLYDLAKETDGSNTLVAFYTQGPMLLAMKRSGNSYFYHNDALGSTSAITASDETVTSTYKYYAFGDVLASTGTLTNAFKYVGGLGYYSDPDSGLLLLRARYYWADVGRFVTRDPANEGVELYAYVGNTPAALVDPVGLTPSCGPWRTVSQEVHVTARSTRCDWYVYTWKLAGSTLDWRPWDLVPILEPILEGGDPHPAWYRAEQVACKWTRKLKLEVQGSAKIVNTLRQQRSCWEWKWKEVPILCGHIYVPNKDTWTEYQTLEETIQVHYGEIYSITPEEQEKTVWRELAPPMVGMLAQTFMFPSDDDTCKKAGPPLGIKIPGPDITHVFAANCPVFYNWPGIL
jgi:RHS repeat-associated protein